MAAPLGGADGFCPCRGAARRLAAVEKDTVSTHFAAAAVARLAPPVRAAVLAEAGIAPEWLARPGMRVTAAAFGALWLAVARAIDDEFFGLDRRRMKVGSFALVARAALGSGRLDRALRQILRGFAVCLDEIGGMLEVQGDEARIRVESRIADPDARRFADETFLVMVHGLACWLAGRRLPIAAAAFAHPRPAHAAELAVMFSETLRFDAPATDLRFDAALLEAPVVQDTRTLAEFLRDAPPSVFLRYKNEDSWSARLRRRLKDCVGQDDWPGLDTLAAEYRIAPATLRRRLEAEGSTYQQLKDRLRRDVAIHQLCTSTQPIADIGRMVGFSEPRAFYRAFKRWSRVQPGEYRALRQRAAGAAGAADGSA